MTKSSFTKTQKIEKVAEKSTCHCEGYCNKLDCHGSQAIDCLAMTRNKGFTLAEVLITLTIIGVVAAITLPTLFSNVNERVQREQIRTAKYKLTLATDKMKSLGLLGEQYGTIAEGNATEEFVAELSKHLKLAKVCDNNHLRECWPTDEINLTDNNTKPVADIKKGQDLQALALSTKNTRTMGIVTADGVPMILVYSPKCTPLEQERTYSWSMIDNKPETNATTNCISAIMDINGKKKPNKIGKDVRSWNSFFGSVNLAGTGYSPLTYNECKSLKDKLGINNCYKQSGVERDDDYWGGAVKYCYDRGLHLPSEQTLAVAAGTLYGRSDITAKTIISSVQFAKSNWKNKDWMTDDMTCEQIWRRAGYNADKVICITIVYTNDLICSTITCSSPYLFACHVISHPCLIFPVFLRKLYG